MGMAFKSSDGVFGVEFYLTAAVQQLLDVQNLEAKFDP